MTGSTERLSSALADRYQILSRLGEGGMATVYLAEDLKHKRQVAIKVLKPELAAVLGAERFVQEITTTASLQHPHILPLFDSGEADSFLYYVMPYIEGETLRTKLDRETQLGIDEAVKIATEVADALDYAHRQGVIHRDIKPENILLHDGRPMVADFGIALAVSAAAGGRMTETGLSLGTPHYMSPEQATAEKEITARSDVFSLGSVLYEMLTGDPPHMASSAQAIIMKIVTEDAQSVTKVRKSVPPNVAAAVAQSLEKLPADRFASAQEFANALRNPSFSSATGVGHAGTLAGASARRPVPTLVLAAIAAIAVAVAAWGWLRPGAPAPVVTQQRVVLGDIMWASSLTRPQLVAEVAIAPDGAIAFIDTVGGRPLLWLKEPGAVDPVPLSGSAGATGNVTFSPDGGWIAYAENNQLFKVPRRFGTAVWLSDSASSIGKPAWLDDGTVVFSGPTTGSLYGVSERGGVTTRLIAAADIGLGGDLRVSPLPGSRVLLSRATASLLDQHIMAFDPATGRLDTLVSGTGWAAYSPTGHLVYAARSGDFWFAPFDPGSFALGEARSMDLQVQTNAGVAVAVLGNDGTFLYFPRQGGSTTFELVQVDRTGGTTILDNLSGFPNGLRLSPEGERLAMPRPAGNGLKIFVMRLPDGPSTQVTFEGTRHRRPAWHPDGTRLLFISNRGDRGDRVWTQRADGGDSASLVVEEERYIYEAFYSPDGNWIVYRTDDDQGAGGGDILAVRTDGDRTPVELIATPAEETTPTMSPDGRWLAYASAETGRKQIWVRPFPDPEGGKWRISIDGGTAPAWSPVGEELFYLSGNGMMMVARFGADNESFEVLERTTLFDGGDYLGPDDDHRYYDVTPDGQRFIMVRRSSTGSRDRPVMMTNFFELLTAEGR